MRKGFWNGLITGGLIGAVAAMFMAPQLKRERKELVHDTKRVKSRARRVIKGVKNIAEDWMK